MTNPVSQCASSFDLDPVQVGKPVSSGGLSRWAEELAFLLGHNVHKIAEVTLPKRIAPRTPLRGLAYSVPIPYARSPGARVLRVGVELWPSDELGDSQTIDVTLPSGAAWLDAGGLDGTVDHYNPPAGRTQPRELVGWIDVTGVTVGSLATWLAVSGVPTSKGEGVRRVTVCEVPLAAIDLTASEPGWDQAATRPGRLVIDGGASSPRGVQRLFYLSYLARSKWKKHFYVGGIESTDTSTSASITPHWHRATASLGPLDFLCGADPAFYLVPRNLHQDGAATLWKLLVRYRTSGSTATDLGIVFDVGSVAGGAWSSVALSARQALTLAGTSGTWTWASGSVSVPALSGGADLVRVQIDATGPGGAELLCVACVGLVEV